MLKIDSNIPLPTDRARRGSLTETLKAMKKGESFTYSKPSSVVTTARRVGVKVTIRKWGSKVRVWRRD